tara:strand:- start:935 stop:1153 length:219 start_codon:yes stop_codon:yes gene_type:complete
MGLNLTIGGDERIESEIDIGGNDGAWNVNLGVERWTDIVGKPKSQAVQISAAMLARATFGVIGESKAPTSQS